MRTKAKPDYSKPATTVSVRKEMARLGIDAQLYRGCTGYYYWSGSAGLMWPSIYSYRISDYTLGEVVAEAMANRERAERGY
jgi:hypothetical protein